MTDTSYNPTFAPYAQWSTQQAPVPAGVHNIPASVAATFAGTSATVTVILQATADALTAISVATGASTLSVQEIF